MSYKIIGDSCLDLTEELKKDSRFATVPLTLQVDDTMVIDDDTFDQKAFLDLVKASENCPKSACPSPDAFKQAMECDEDDVYIITLSSHLSGSYNSARLAAEELSEKYPDRKIIVIDSLCASLGEGLLVHKAVTLKEQGHTLEETADWLESNKLHLVHNFTVNDLFHLYRGGRVSKTAAFLGTMISLKPLLHVDDEGHLIPLSKVRGRKKSLIALVDAMEKQIGSWRDKNDIIFISHGDCIEDAQYVADLIKDRFGYESFLINHVGPTIGAHTGPGVVALFYMGDYR